MEGWAELPGNVFIGVDVSKEGDACVEGEKLPCGKVRIIDIYNFNPAPSGSGEKEKKDEY